jgi:1-acyl-sn-glycerol-3-phosphate acyltransferase
MKEQYFIQPTKIYAFLKKYVSFTYRVFYDDICVEGAENIPDNIPVIFTPNHQNALMDALAVIVHSKKQPVFVARADLFQSPYLRKLLNTIKIIPVYRIRDGYENLSNNDESLEITQKCLFASNSVGIMPEGTQTDKQQLQPLKKGFARLALSAQELIGSKPGIVIIPVGIHYSNYFKFRSNVHISFGKPIEVTEYIALYKENPAKAFVQLKERLFAALKQQMVSIDNNDFYELIRDTKDIVAGELTKQDTGGYSFANHVKAEKQISECLSHALLDDAGLAKELEGYVTEYHNTLKRLQLCNEAFGTRYPKENTLMDTVRFLFFLPFVAAGALFNAIPALVTSYLSKKTDDPQFISSIKFGVGNIAFLIYYLLWFAVPIPFITKILLVLVMPLLGILSYDYFKGLRIFWGTMRLRNGLNNNDPDISRLIYIRSQIIKRVKNCMGID